MKKNKTLIKLFYFNKSHCFKKSIATVIIICLTAGLYSCSSAENKTTNNYVNQRLKETVIKKTVSNILAFKKKPSTNKPSKKELSKITPLKNNEPDGKPVIYQVFTRLFGNKNTTNKPWGTIQDNGVGKFNDFTELALKGIKEFGTTHIWYTGILHHNVITDYTKYGISNDDPDIVKGRAGSPYAIKDYYNVNPDLAVNPNQRLQEFKALIKRTHQHDMKVIIDIIPNHIARNYHSISNPIGVSDFGLYDDTSVEYKRDNNFYYVVGKDFIVPDSTHHKNPLNGESHPLLNNYFKESPAKWTGNGARKAQPDINDWYETVKVNYGVRPNGVYDFNALPKNFASKNFGAHYAYWKNKTVPDSWVKFKNIALYWLNLGVDGFRYDMAEMVPVEFWSYLNSAIKMKNSSATLIAEVYNPSIYRDYIHLGKMDYLYDKVDFYDTIKGIMQGKQQASDLLPIINKFSDIDQYLLHFLENHDEQRIASQGFLGVAKKGKPGMVVSTLIGKAPTMLYFAQALGEAAIDEPGFGESTRTSIFDYWGVASLQRWMNNGKFDGGKLTLQEKQLRSFYTKLLSFSSKSSALQGDFYNLHSLNVKQTEKYDESFFSFARWSNKEKLIIISHFSDHRSVSFNFKLDNNLIKQWKLTDGKYSLRDVLSDSLSILTIKNGIGEIKVQLKPLESRVWQLERVM